MKTLLFVSLLLHISIRVKAADTLVTKLINAIYMERVDKAAPYYYLMDSAKNPAFNNWDLEELARDRHIDTTTLPIREFIKKLQNDTSAITWVGYNFSKARIINKRQRPKYNSSYRVYKYFAFDTPDSVLSKLDPAVVPVLVKNGMNKGQLKAALQTATRKYEDRPKEEKNWFYFSKPIFSDDKNYVLISMNDADHGCNYIFKRSGSGWLNVLQFKCWVS